MENNAGGTYLDQIEESFYKKDIDNFGVQLSSF